MREIPGIVDVTTDLQITSPQVLVDINRDKASSLGISAGQIERALGNAYGARQISTIYTPTDQYRVILEADEDFKRESADLSRLYVRSSGGRLVPLSAVAQFKSQVGPLTVQHLGQLPAVTLSFDLAKGTSLSDVVPVIERVAKAELGEQVSTQFQGTAQAFQSSLGNLGMLLLMAVLVIYIILGILYESFIHPLTILSGLPSAGFGALLTLALFGQELNVYGFVGLLMLIGIVKKNAIMMIDFALDAQRNDRKPPATAIFDACIVRFRPIMMTTLAAMMGTLPIALGLGAGGDVRRPSALPWLASLVISQIVTLYITPIIYLTSSVSSSGLAGEVRIFANDRGRTCRCRTRFGRIDFRLSADLEAQSAKGHDRAAKLCRICDRISQLLVSAADAVTRIGPELHFYPRLFASSYDEVFKSLDRLRLVQVPKIVSAKFKTARTAST